MELVRRVASEELGVTTTPVLIADRSNSVYRLDPYGIVARVAMATSAARVGIEWLRREVDLARFLEQRGAPVTRPVAGPFERDGFVISFWLLEQVVAERADPTEAGKTLARVHLALADYPKDRLPPWGAWTEARKVFDAKRYSASELARIEPAWERAEHIVQSARSRTSSFQAVHGDAHIGNVMATSRGAVWTDWEDAFIGPIEYDIACLRSKLDLFGEEKEGIEAMLAAYDASYNRALAEDLGLVRNVQVIAWLALFAERQPELLPRMRARIDRLP
jgi:aminoglycoside phosphotransferase (APT) family kinase protein